MRIEIELRPVKLGVIEAQGIRVGPTDANLARLIEELCERKHREFTVETLAQAEPVRAVRAMFRAWGIDPSKYRPSSEALLRRVVQGKGLYRVSNVVDIGNLGSIEAGWPYGCYDHTQLHPPIALRLGAAGESYEAVGKRVWHLEGRPVLADRQGPFGSPISDSTRTMIGEATRDALLVIYAPFSAGDTAVQAAVALLGERLRQFAGAAIQHAGVCR